MKVTNYACLKGQMGSWQYYLCRLPFGDAVEYLHYAEEVRPNPDLDDILQRELSGRSSEIASYLKSNDDRFFGALIVAVYGGSPKFSPIEIEGAAFLGGSVDGVGVLRFDGKERYYVLDGQHRLAAMRQAVADDPVRYTNDQISVILVSHTDDEEGVRRARRLFTNVNRYAVKTNKGANIVIDEDDPIAILTRRLVRESEYFAKVVRITKRDKAGKRTLVTGEALRAGTDDPVLMTLPTLYECNRGLLGEHQIVTKSCNQLRPSDAEIELAWQELNHRWSILLQIEDFQAQSNMPEFSRNMQDGGPIVARPIAQKAITAAVGAAIDAGVSSVDVVNAVTRSPKLSDWPWKGLLWNPQDGSMLAGKARIDMATEIFCFWFRLDVDLNALKEKYRVLTGGAAFQ